MSQRIVIDNSALLPAFFPERESSRFDAKLVSNRAASLVQSVRLNRIIAYVPPSLYREFLNNACILLNERMNHGQQEELREVLYAHWQTLLELPLVVIDVAELTWRAGELAIREGCPAADAWYVAAAEHAKAKFWMSHRHSDDLFAIASRFVSVGLLSDESPIS